MENLNLIVLCALRYALPRHTYITSVVADFIWENKDNPEIKKAMSLIKRDLKEWIEENPPNDTCSKIDYDTWVALSRRLEKL